MIVCRLRIGTQDPLNTDEGSFEELDSYDLEAYESVNVLLDDNLPEAADHAILELIFPMGEVTLATFKKVQTHTKKGKTKVRWRLA